MYLLEITVYNKQNVFHINLKYINNITTKNAQHISFLTLYSELSYSASDKYNNYTLG